MREEDSNWLPKWEDELPPPNELISLSQSLITPHLASAFDIHTPPSHHHHNHHSSSPQLLAHYHHQQQSSSVPPAPNLQPNSSEFDSSSAELGGGAGGGGGASSGGGGSEEPARTLKRPRLVWTPQLHKRFVDAVGHLGIKNAVPKTIMQLMSVDGLTRENVASHLQKYRLYLKRMQGGLSNGNGAGPGGGPGGPGAGLMGSGDPATDHLFASSPVPPHFLHQSGGGGGGGGGGPIGRPNSEHFMPYMPVTALNHHQMAAAAVAGHQQIQSQYQHHHHRQMGHFGPGQGGGQFEHPFLSRQAQFGPNRNGLMQNNNNSGYMDDVEDATTANNGRKVLTLFPTGDD